MIKRLCSFCKGRRVCGENLNDLAEFLWNINICLIKSNLIQTLRLTNTWGSLSNINNRNRLFIKSIIERKCPVTTAISGMRFLTGSAVISPIVSFSIHANTGTYRVLC